MWSDSGFKILYLNTVPKSYYLIIYNALNKLMNHKKYHYKLLVISNKFIIKSKNYKLYTYIYYNYSIEGMRKKKNLEEYCRIKFDIKCVFFLSLFLKQNAYSKYLRSITSFTKSIKFDLNIKIVIAVST